MARIRKYAKGAPIETTMDAVEEVLSGRYVIVGDKPVHPSWMRSQQLNTISNYVWRGVLFRAIATPGWVQKQHDELCNEIMGEF